jgi:DNA invertase Pin-like site-specific DNA recombinase
MSQPDTSARYAIYARVSTREQASEGTSLGTQVTTCQNYIASQGGILVDTYVDEGVSGAKESRPALDRLMNAVRGGEVSVVVVAKLDRFGRSMRHLSTLLGELDDRGVRFVSVSEAFDSSSPSGRLHRAILGSFAEFERERIIERTTTGKAAVAREGRWPGGRPPYGFRLERLAGGTRLGVDEDEKEILVQIVSLLVDEGCSTGDAAKRLNSLGITTRHGRPWSVSRIQWLLAGGVPLDGRWGYAPTGGTRRRPGEPMFWVEVPRLLGDERVAALKSALARTATGTQTSRRHYLLTPLPSPCGSHYRGKVAHGQHTYRCTGVGCGCPTIPAKRAEDAVWNEVVSLLGDPGRIEMLMERWVRNRGAIANVERENLVTVDRRIARLERHLREKVGEYLRAGVPADAVRRAADEIEGEISQLRSHRGRLAAYQERENRRGEGLSQLAAYARDTLTNADEALRARVLGWLKVEVDLTSTERCPTCDGHGKLPGGRGGLRCTTCDGTRTVARFHVRGEVPEALLAAGGSVSAGGEQEAGAVAWPFDVGARIG